MSGPSDRLCEGPSRGWLGTVVPSVMSTSHQHGEIEDFIDAQGGSGFLSGPGPKLWMSTTVVRASKGFTENE